MFHSTSDSSSSSYSHGYSSSTSSTASAASPTPISPFSTYSVAVSEATSDELPDLGAFTTVFRALNHLQHPRTFIIPTAQDYINAAATANTITDHDHGASEMDSSVLITQSSDDPADSDAPGRIIASYLQSNYEHDSLHHHHNRGRDTNHQGEDTDDLLSISPSDDDDDGDRDEDEGYALPSSASGSDTEGEPEGRLVEIEGFSDVDGDPHPGRPTPGPGPSLGYLEEALRFIAEERASYERVKGVSSVGVSSEAGVVEGDEGEGEGEGEGGKRRRRRRRRSRPRRMRVRLQQGLSSPGDAETTEGVEGTEGVDDDDDDDFSESSLEDAELSFGKYRYRSTPGTPRRRVITRKPPPLPLPPSTASAQKTTTTNNNNKLRQSKSTPNLDLSLTSNQNIVVPPIDPRTLRLRSLTHKLR